LRGGTVALVATASDSEDVREAPAGDPSRGVEFALDSFDVAEGRLVVAGRWYGVTGRRFVRPVLQVDGQRRLIALLDHKPWSAEEGVQWLAAFPHDGSVGPSRLQVAPDITVEIPAAGPEAGDGKPRPARLARTPVGRSALEAEAAAADTPPRAGRKTQDARTAVGMEAERDAALAEVEAIGQEKDKLRADADRLRVELDQARREIERVSTELDHTRADADRLRTELSHVRAEANTLRPAHEDTKAMAERLEADVGRLRADAQRAIAERNAAHAELERLRAPARQPYIAPRPMAFRDSDPRPDWRIRAVAAVLVLAMLALLVQLLFGVV
jgi:hypothetical protein